MINFCRLRVPRFLECRSYEALGCLQANGRAFADTVHTDKQLVQLRGTESEQRVRVRRARSADVPRVLRFVREHARAAWPCLGASASAPTAASQLVLADLVARALAQGHSMLAEQITARRGWLSLRGLALASAVCPWDALVLDDWARCMRDPRARSLVRLTAHCLRGPNLHEKYAVRTIMQVIMILSPECQNNPEIVQLLAKNAIQHGRESGFPLLRFDVSQESIASALTDMQLKKEWSFNYDVIPTDAVMETIGSTPPDASSEVSAGASEGGEGGQKPFFLAVYSASTLAKPETIDATSAPAHLEKTTKPGL